jgi:cysteine desulfurase
MNMLKKLYARRIYLDYASLTPVDKRVLKVVAEYSKPKYMNPSAIHLDGVFAKKTLDNARAICAKSIGAHMDEIVFTGSGTEANNLAIRGLVQQLIKPHIIVSAIEHSSVLEVVKALVGEGAVDATVLPVDANGVVNVDELKKVLRPETVLVSIMMTNNEIGTVQPVSEIVKIVRRFRKANVEASERTVGSNIQYPLIHTDACQAFLYEEIDMSKLGVDMLTLDAHKVYGPRGVGMLYVRRGVELSPIIHGGGQEKGLRSGTENIPGIVGFAKALEIARESREQECLRVANLQSIFIEGLKSTGVGIQVNCESAPRSPHIVNVCIPGIDAEFFVLQLDVQGIACSTKSSCLHDEDESYVLKAVGVSSKNSVRFSFGRMTKKADILKVLKVIRKILLNSV